MDLLHDYVKKEEIRANTKARGWCLYGVRTCPSQDNLVDLRSFSLRDCRSHLRGTGGKRTSSRWPRILATELREDSVTEIKSSQLELFPEEEPDWSFDDLAEELEQLTDPTKWSLRLPAGEETPEWIGALQEEVDSVNPPEGAAGTSSGDMEIDRGMSPKPILLARVSPMDEGDVLSLSPGWSMGSSIEIIPDPEEEECIRVALSVTSQPEESATRERMDDPPEQPHCTKTQEDPRQTPYYESSNTGYKSVEEDILAHLDNSDFVDLLDDDLDIDPTYQPGGHSAGEDEEPDEADEEDPALHVDPGPKTSSSTNQGHTKFLNAGPIRKRSLEHVENYVQPPLRLVEN
ncbi:hypothetical protein J6590_100755 [Homalodisca vitripennis]|nr:hypothetical protein J6590_100755 [Homalodisca vitripennis]